MSRCRRRRRHRTRQRREQPHLRKLRHLLCRWRPAGWDPWVVLLAAGSASLDQLFGADGIQMTYAGAQLAPGYMEGDYYEMTPDAGKQYLVLSIDVTNTGADGVGLDVLSVSPKFTVVLNQSVKSTAETTLLDTDFSTYQGTIPAGGSTRLVLVFQVPDDVASADSVELYVQMDQMIQIIL